MVATLATSGLVYLIVRADLVRDLVVGRPEVLGLVVAAQVLLVETERLFAVSVVVEIDVESHGFIV